MTILGIFLVLIQKKEDFLVVDAVTNAINIVKPTLSYHKVEISTYIDLDYKINGFKNEYSQAIVNIISNAKDILIDRKILNPKIKIYLDIKEEIRLCIEDNAGGVDKEIIDKIFDPYFTTKYEYGTGIGLYMTKLIIEEKMNGTINVKKLKRWSNILYKSLEKYIFDFYYIFFNSKIYL